MQRSMANSPVLKEKWDLGRQTRFLKTANLSFLQLEKLKLDVLRNPSHRSPISILHVTKEWDTAKHGKKH